MARITAGIIGIGYIGTSQIEAINRLGYARVGAIMMRDAGRARAICEKTGIPKFYTDYRELLNDPEIQVIHNCTPNHLHYPMNLEIIAAGKHILSEKPLTLFSKESAELTRLAAERQVANGVNFINRHFPIIQHIKGMIDAGELGTIYAIHGAYLQDWLLYDTDYDWRVDPEMSGPSRAVGDIGSHWFDMAQYLLGSKISEVNADLATVIPIRKKTDAAGAVEEVAVHTEDFGTMMFHFENGVRGCVTVSQVSAGRKSEFSLEINGSKASVYWNQETPHSLWIGHRNQPNQTMISRPNLLNERGKTVSILGSGYERWPEAQKNLIHNFYSTILEGAPPQYATFADAHQTMRVIDAVLASHQSRAWRKVGE
jgi:predicted dehydrogenase